MIKVLAAPTPGRSEIAKRLGRVRTLVDRGLIYLRETERELNAMQKKLKGANPDLEDIDIVLDEFEKALNEALPKLRR